MNIGKSYKPKRRNTSTIQSTFKTICWYIVELIPLNELRVGH